MTDQNILRFERKKKWNEFQLEDFSGVLLSVEVIFLGVSLFVIFAILTYFFEGASFQIDSLKNIFTVIISGVLVWSASHGSAIFVNGVTFNFIPLGGTLIVMIVFYFCSKKYQKPGRLDNKSIIIGATSYAVIVVIMCYMFGSNSDKSGVTEFRLFIISFIMALISFYIGGSDNSFFSRLYNRFSSNNSSIRWINSRVLVSGFRASLIGISVLLIIGSIVTLFSTVANYQITIKDLQILNTNPFSTFILGLDELLLLPNIVIWNISLTLGTGFDFGYGGGYNNIPLPVLNSIDPTISMAHINYAVWSIFILIGAICSIYIWKWTQNAFFAFGYSEKSIRIGKFTYYFSSVLLGVVFFFIGIIILGEISSGEIKTGTLGAIGVHPYAFAFHSSIFFAIGEILSSIPLSISRFMEKPETQNSSIFKIKVSEEIHKIPHNRKSRKYGTTKK